MLKTFKKTIPYLLVVIIALLAVFGPFGAQDAMAQNEKEAGSFWGIWKNPLHGVLSILNYLIYYAVFTPASWLLVIAGKIFNGAIGFSINSEIFRNMSQTGSAVADGWAICRDITNIFFIFILIFIGIATILQLQTYGYRKLLIKVIILALLVNFSLVATRMVIDASNILAMQFYNAFTTASDKSIQINAAGDHPKDLSAIFVASFKLQKIYEKLPEKDSQGEMMSGIFIVTLFGTILMLIAAFVLLAGGMLFIIRMVVLWILMIFAPLAFVGMILPMTQGYAKKWWTTLFQQSFFAPAFLFMYYLAAKIAESKFLETMQGNNPTENFAAVFKAGGNYEIIFTFIIMAAMLIGSLIVAKQMGAMGAQTAINLGTSARKWATGYAGKIAKKPPTWAARATVVSGAEKILPKMKGIVAKSPRLGGWAAEKVKGVAESAGRKEQLEKRITRGMVLPAKERATYLSRLRDSKAQEEMFKKMPARERVELIEKDEDFKPTYERLMNKLPVEEKEKTKKVQKEVERKNLIKRIADTEPPIKPEEITKIHEAINAKEIQDIAKEGGKKANKFFESLKLLGKTNEEIAQRFQELGNKSAASFMIGSPSMPILKAYGIKIEKAEKGKEVKKVEAKPPWKAPIAKPIRTPEERQKEIKARSGWESFKQSEELPPRTPKERQKELERTLAQNIKPAQPLPQKPRKPDTITREDITGIMGSAGAVPKKEGTEATPEQQRKVIEDIKRTGPFTMGKTPDKEQKKEKPFGMGKLSGEDKKKT